MSGGSEQHSANVADSEDGLWAGAQTRDITPGLGADLAGLFQARFADRIESPLQVKALALRSQGVTLLLISCDLLMMRAVDIVDRAKAGITERCGVPASQVLISATHTHSGPATVPNNSSITAVDPAYLERVIVAIVEAAVEACAVLRPARLGYGQAPAHGVCFNRRSRRKDGLVQTNAPADRDDIIGPAGPIDPTVTGLIVEERDGTPIAFWANLSLHYVNAGTSTSISSDYFGAFGRQMAALLGAPVHAQLTNGASGDINNIDRSKAVTETGEVRANLVATAVVGAAAAGTMMARREIDVVLSSQLLEVELERWPITEEDLQIAQDFLDGKRDDAPYSYVSGIPIGEGLREAYAKRTQQVAELPERATAPVMIMTIGELCVVGLPGEIFVEHGLAIRQGSRYPMTAVVGLANDHVGYVPTRKAYAEGGYETWRSLVSWTGPGAGEVMVDRVLEVIGK